LISLLIVARTEELVSHAIERMRKYKISQIPVMDMSFVGSLMSLTCFKVMYMIKLSRKKRPRKSWEVPPIVQMGTSIEEVSKLFNRDNAAVLIDLGEGRYHIIKI
jgi:cystathionine beta-synthase